MAYCQSPNCPGFELFNGELYCPWCGSQRALHAVSLQILVDESWQDLTKPLLEGQPARLRLVVECLDSRTSLLFQSCDLKISSEWLKPVSTNKKNVITRKTPLFIELSYQPPLLSQTSDTAHISLKLSPCDEYGNQIRWYNGEFIDFFSSLTLEVYALPKFQCKLNSASEECIAARGSNSQVPFLLWIEGCRAELQSLSVSQRFPGCTITDIAWWNGPQICGQTTLPIQLFPNGSGGPAAIQAVLNVPENFSKNLNGRLSFELELGYSFLNPAQGSVENKRDTLTLPVVFQGQPKLQINHFSEERFYRWEFVEDGTLEHSLPLSVANIGEPSSVLQINSCIISPVISYLPSGSPAGSISSQTLDPNRPYCPLTLVWPQDKAQAFPIKLRSPEQFALILRQILPLGPGTYAFKLQFATNAVPEPIEYTLQLKVAQPEAFSGFMAVDLGTSGSCVSIVGDTIPDPELVDVDKNNPDDAQCLRSVLEYRRIAYSAADSDIEAGYYAWLASFNRPYSTVMAPKRDLGRPNFAYEITPSRETSKILSIHPEQAVEHLYYKLVTTVKDLVKNGSIAGLNRGSCQCRNFVISHPSRFSPIQIGQLEGAARRAFSQVFMLPPEAISLELIPEPVAAAFSYLSQEETHSYWHNQRGSDEVSYTILVYDCGGGTTDLSLLQISSKRFKAKALGVEPRELEDVLNKPKWRDFLNRALEILISKTNKRGVSSSYLDPDLIRQRFTDDSWLRGWDNSAGLPFTYAELSEQILKLAQEDYRNPFHYSVRVRQLGASGDSTFGGENMTAVILDLLLQQARQNLKASSEYGPDWDIPIDYKKGLNDAERRAARSNWQSLYYWAEEAKCHVKSSFILPNSSKDAAGTAEARLGLKVVKGGEIRDIHLLDILKGQFPTVDKAEKNMHDRIVDTYRACRYLLDEGLGLDKWPDILLLSGRASQWPQLSRCLRNRFPEQVRLVRLTHDLKQCVADGAARWRHALNFGGISPDIPGVFMTVENSVSSVPSRLGTIQRLGIGSRFVQIIGAGHPFDAEGKAQGSISWTVTSANLSITAYENSGIVDVLTAENNTTSKLGDFYFEIPGEYVGQTGRLSFTLTQDSQLSATLSFDKPSPWSQEQTCGTVALGRGY